MSNIVYIASSLDGYIARKDGNIDWLMEYPNPDNSDFGFSAFMERIDGILMGRVTFETVLSFGQWPYTKPVFVLSNTLKELPHEYSNIAEVVHGDLPGIIDSLNSKGIKHLYIDGGKTIHSFLELDLIDELIITRTPILLGSGIPLFANMEREIRFELTSTEILTKDMVKSTYTKKN